MIMWYCYTCQPSPSISVDLEPWGGSTQPETRETGRSAFVRSAVSRYLAAKRRKEIDSAIGAAYGNVADAMEAEVSDLLDAQAWPRD
jgi:hypothetical protein